MNGPVGHQAGEFGLSDRARPRDRPFDELARDLRNRRVLVTGHSGFKGTWLSLWLLELGAQVRGLALPAEAQSLFTQVGGLEIPTVTGDIRNFDLVRSAIDEADPEVIFHLAAQPLVLRGYREPRLTVETNIMGTVNIVEAVRARGARCAVVIVSSDKCYAPRPQRAPHREGDALGGEDVYSASKGAMEILVNAYRASFFSGRASPSNQVAIATARAGNTIGGGDWASDRLVPDAIRALAAGRTLLVRNPGAIRPWQHVLEPLAGYLYLAAKLLAPEDRVRSDYSAAWNFGPDRNSDRTVQELVEAIVREWGSGDWRPDSRAAGPAELDALRLDSERAAVALGWSPRWPFARAVAETVAWYRAWSTGSDSPFLRELAVEQIHRYMSAP
jgi:CDP-glucose 4,6-dehydratase